MKTVIRTQEEKSKSQEIAAEKKEARKLKNRQAKPPVSRLAREDGELSVIDIEKGKTLAASSDAASTPTPQSPLQPEEIPPQAREGKESVMKMEITEFDASGDFASMLAGFEGPQSVNFEIGSKVRGKFLMSAGDFAFFDLGAGKEASMNILDIKDEEGNVTLSPGDTMDAFVTGFKDGITIGKALDAGSDSKAMLEDAFASKMPIEGKVTGTNKGGFDVEVGGTRCFCPKGQIDNVYFTDSEVYVGQTHHFQVSKFDEGGRNIVLSRRVILDKEKEANLEKVLATIDVGDRVEGKVTRIEDYGVFVDLGGISGLVPNSELGYGSFSTARERMKIGDSLEVAILAIDDDPKRQGEKRIRLSVKTILPDPFTAHLPDLKIGSLVPGKVARMESFGAFVELFAGVDGLIHISEVANQRIRHPSDVLKVGQEVSVRVLDVDPLAQRISLSLKDESPGSMEQTFRPKSQEKSLGTLGDLFAGKLG